MTLAIQPSSRSGVRGTDGVDDDAVVPMAETEEVAHMFADDEVLRALDVQTQATEPDLRDVPETEMEFLPFADKQADPNFRQKPSGASSTESLSPAG